MYPSRKRPAAAGLTLIELLIASSIMAIMAGVLGALAMSVQMQSEHSAGHGEAVQHARVVIDRLQRLMNEATANDQFPGFLVVTTNVGTYRFPDAVAIWNPDGAPANPTGMPRWNEVVVIGPDPQNPNVLLEVRSPGDTRTVPAASNSIGWQTEVISLLNSSSAERVELTDLLRSASAALATNSGQSTLQMRGAVRFDVRQRPSQAEWVDYQAGRVDWSDLSWAQGIHGTRTGLRQSWCRIELQLVPGTAALTDDAQGQSVLTFFGSAAVYHELHK